MPDLSIVIVNWNTCDLLQDCLETVYLDQGNLDLEVFVVDNASTDGSTLMVQERFPQVRLIVNQENVGFARANNQAFPLCQAPYVLLLNSDTRIREGAFFHMLQFMQKHTEAGAIGPKVVHPKMRLRVLSCGYQPTPRTLFNHYFFLSTLFPHWSFFHGLNLIMGIHDDHERPVEWISGSCLLVRRNVIKQVGGLNERWFMYAEDMEWCDRIKKAGWELYHVPGAVIEHYMGASAEKNPKVSTIWIPALREYYINRSAPSQLQLALFDAALIYGLTIRASLYGLRSLVNKSHRDMWQTERLKFLAYIHSARKAAQIKA